ncbi:TPA: tail fiber protein, partial [Haemophilus influenzae]
MALVNKPDESIFASSAKQGEVDNFPDLLRGWGVTFDQTQGIPPMEWFNFLFKRLDEKHTYLMQRGLPEWSATQDYTKGSCVQFDGVSYRALKKSKNNRPNESGSQYWVRWGFALNEIAQATLQQYGLVQLSSAINSGSETQAATSKAVKIAYDKAVDAKTTAESKVGLRGNESIQGTKSFESKIIGFRGIGVADSQTYANANHLLNMGANDGDGWIEYKKSNRVIGTIRIRANGELSYNNQKIYHAGAKPQFNTDIEGKPNTLAGYGIGNFKVEQGQGDANGYKTDGNYYLASGQNLPENGEWHIEVVSGGATNAVRQIARKANDNKIKTRFFNGSNWSEWKDAGGDGVPIGAVVSFPRAVTNPVGFLRADGSTFSQQTFPDLYRTLGDSNQLPDLTRSDVGMTAYFAVDNIPNGWIAFDSIRTTVTQQNYPELYRHLVGKYGS